MWFKSIVRTVPEPLSDGLQVPGTSLALEAGPLQPQSFLHPSLLSGIALVSTKAVSNPSAFAHTAPLPSFLSLPICCNQALPPPSQPGSLPSCHASPQIPIWALTYQASLHSGDTGCHLLSPFPGPAPFICLSQLACVTIKRVPVDLNWRPLLP